MIKIGLILLFVFISLGQIRAKETKGVHFINATANTNKNVRNKRLFSVFQVVSFPNDGCTGSSRNGTCYTAEECTARAGTNSGTCASGFGVCCIFILSCGQMSNDNCTYIIQSTTTSSPVNGDGPCEYTICPTDSNVCRIRFDFNTFNIVGPQAGTTATAGNGGTTMSGSIGDCVTDTFSITAPGQVGSPQICGFNDGQHMIVDASPQCHRASFDIGGGTSQREWDIKVTQYSCSDFAGMGGPDGCLQYFTGTSGRVSNFAFPTTLSTIAASSATHISNQLYTMCFRQERGFCAICFIPAITDDVNDAAINQNSFGLGVSAAPTDSSIDTNCESDYLEIPHAENGVTIGTIPIVSAYRLCGRYFNAMDNTISTAANSVCTQTKPFRMMFRSDLDEITGTAAAATNEQDNFPGGIVGFSLNYVQQAC